MEGNNAFHDGFSFDSTRCRTVTCEGWDRLYRIKEVEGILYLCYGNQPMRPIHRIDHDEHGCTRESWAFGRWADVESLRYIPINQTMEIDANEWEAT